MMSWNEWVCLYRKYKEEYGHEPPSRTVYHGRNLGKWCSHQKHKYRTNKLSAERYRQLLDAGFAFNNMRDEAWENSFNLYRTYKTEYGCEPLHNTVYHNYHIGWWCSDQRKMYKKGRLSAERIQRLTDVDFVFTSLDVRHVSWDYMLELYRDYKNEFGREPINSTVYREQPLGSWRKRQRRAYRQNKLSPERLQLLIDANFSFERLVSVPVEWDTWLQLYRDYKDEFGVEPSTNTVFRGRNLGIWCIYQRSCYWRNDLSAERIQKLTDANFSFDLAALAWDGWLELYITYKKEYGSEPESKTVYKNRNLGPWCDNQRQFYKRGTLSAERIQRLSDAGFVFNVNENTWNNWLTLYCDFKSVYGYEPKGKTRVYRGKNLGRWYEAQRRAYQEGRLSPERIQRLSSVGFALR